MPGIISQTKAVEARVQAISPELNWEPITGSGGGSVTFMSVEDVVSTPDVAGKGDGSFVFCQETPQLV